MERDPFKEYLKESKPDKAGKSYAWSAAIGLQAVDGLKPSQYLIDHSYFRQTSIFPFIENCFKVYISMQVKSETTISQKKNGCLMGQL